MGSFAPLMPAGAINVALSNYMKEFKNNAFIGDAFAPKVPVERQSFQYVVWNRDDFRVPGSTLRAPGDRPSSTRRSYSTAPYFAQSHALETAIPFESESYGLGLGFSTRKMATKQLANQIHLDREVRTVSLLTSSAFTNSVALTNPNQFDNYPATPETGTGSHPIVLIEDYKSLLRSQGVQDSEMVLAISDPVALVLRNHPDVIDRFKFTNAGGIITNEMLSQLFGVKVIIGSAISLNQQNVPSWVWGNNCFLGYAQAAPTQDDISCAKTFVWAGGSDGMGQAIPGPMNTVDGYGVLEWIESHLSEKKYWQSVDWYYDLRATAPETGIAITNCLGTYPPVAMETVASDVEG